MTDQNFKDPNQEANKYAQDLFLLAVLITARFKRISNILQNFGLCLNNLGRRKYIHLAEDYRVFRRREELWDYAIREISEGPFIGLEFGVAWGYSTNYWITRCTNLLRWHCFDTFTGLPESWRHYSKGHFSNHGQPPRISNKKVEWHVGYVEETFYSESIVCKRQEEKLVVLLDLDLFFPTYHVLSNIAHHLKAGDLIYFDEPHDNDEGSILHLFMRINGDKLSVAAASPCQILLEVRSEGVRLPPICSQQ